MEESDSFRGTPPLIDKNPPESSPPKSRFLLRGVAVMQTHANKNWKRAEGVLAKGVSK